METNLPTLCYNCSKPLPSTGYFCGACLTQFKCKSCDTILEKDYVGCVNCGTPRLNVEKNTTTHQNINTFRLHETKDERTIDAAFSDDVAKDLAGILRDTTSANRIKTITSNIPSSNNFNSGREETIDFAEAEVLNNGNDIPKAEAVPAPTSSTTTPHDYPALKAIAMKKLPGTEAEWLVVYAFYASNFGKDTFTRQDLIEKYEESNRLDTGKKNALSIYITRAVQANLINPLTDSYSILDAGIQKAKEIISRTSSSPTKSKSSSKGKKENGEDDIENKKAKGKKSSSGLQSYKRLTDINFYPSGHKSLVDFIKDYKIKNDNERNLLFTHYLSEILKISPITLNHLYTSYDEVNHKIPENMTQSLNNTKSRTGWLKTNNSNIEITTKGVNKLKIWDKKD